MCEQYHIRENFKLSQTFRQPRLYITILGVKTFYYRFLLFTYRFLSFIYYLNNSIFSISDTFIGHSNTFFHTFVFIKELCNKRASM